MLIIVGDGALSLGAARLLVLVDPDAWQAGLAVVLDDSNGAEVCSEPLRCHCVGQALYEDSVVLRLHLSVSITSGAGKVAFVNAAASTPESAATASVATATTTVTTPATTLLPVSL